MKYQPSQAEIEQALAHLAQLETYCWLCHSRTVPSIGDILGQNGKHALQPMLACPRECSACGCRCLAPCAGGCSWIAPDLCSACAPAVRSAEFRATALRFGIVP